jgi:hypothetical protein
LAIFPGRLGVIIGDFPAGVEELSVFEVLGLGVVLEVLEVLGDEFLFELGDKELVFGMCVDADEREVPDKAVGE